MQGELLVPPAHSRPVSRASRPSSRVSQYPAASRPSGRHPSARLTTLASELIAHFHDNSKGDPKDATRAIESLAKTLESGKYSIPLQDVPEMDKRIRGIANKHMVLLDEDLSEAILERYSTLKQHVEETFDRDSQIKTKNVPDALQLLFALSNPPDSETRLYASNLLERQRNPNGSRDDSLTWERIFAEEPLEGQHWEGAHWLPSGSTVEGWEYRKPFDSSDSDLSDLDDIEGHLKTFGPRSRIVEHTPQHLSDSESSVDLDDEPNRVSLDARMVVEELETAQYWRTKAPEQPVGFSVLDLGDPGSLGPTVHRVSGHPDFVQLINGRPHYIMEIDAVREVLFALQGNPSILISSSSSDPLLMPTVEVSPKIPMIPHFSIASFRSVLDLFVKQASTMCQLRAFTQAVFKASYEFTSTSAPRPPTSHTLEAFAAAVDKQVRKFDAWCAVREQELCQARSGRREEPGASLTCSLLRLQVDTTNYMGESFDLLLATVHDLQSLRRTSHSTLFDFSTLHPSVLSTHILESLITASRGEKMKGLDASATLLTEVFILTAEPFWSSIGLWMKHGMDFTEADNAAETGHELFIQRNDEVSISTPEFWAEGYNIRSQDDVGENLAIEYGARTSIVPSIVRSFAADILSAGKSVGLLRVLQVDDFFSSGEGAAQYQWMEDWPTFGELIATSGDLADPHRRRLRTAFELDESAGPDHASAFGQSRNSDPGLDGLDSSENTHSAISAEDVASLIRESLEPWCRLAHARLNRVVVNDCDLWLHLNAIEGLFFMRQEELTSRFRETLFGRIRQRQPWNDYHTLNSMFRDVALASTRDEPWLDHNLVRLTFRGLRTRDPAQTVKAFEGLIVEYQVPFPLTYLLGPSSIRVYSAIFVLLLQLRFVGSVLDQLSTRVLRTRRVDGLSSEDIKAFCAVRSRLIWFINTLMHYMSANVLQMHVERLHESLEGARSLDEMIAIHDEALTRLDCMCLTGSSTSPIRKAILSALDLALRLNDYYDTAQHEGLVIASPSREAESRVARTQSRRRRLNRAQRSRRKNVIGFVSEAEARAYSQDEEDQDEAAAAQEEADILQEITRDENEEINRPDEESRGDTSLLHSQTQSQFSSFFAEAPFVDRVEKLGSELDVLVRVVMQHVESRCAGGNDDASDSIETEAFSMLNFAFEDWYL